MINYPTARQVPLACAVNLVELLRSAGVPVVYTQVLAISDLSRWQYYAYLALYVAVFMLDDLMVLVRRRATARASARSAPGSRRA